MKKIALWRAYFCWWCDHYKLLLFGLAMPSYPMLRERSDAKEMNAANNKLIFVNVSKIPSGFGDLGSKP